MIELYIPSNTTYTKHGDMILAPISCEVSAELNGAWQLTLLHPLDAEGRWKSISEGAVIRADSFNGSQLFRITQCTKSDAGVEAYADPIFMDARNDCFVLDTRPTNVNGQAALTALCGNNVKYTGSSDITSLATGYFINRNLIDCIAGTESPTFLERWGGEIYFDNFKIYINTRQGGDYGVQVLYGRNITGIRETINLDGVITRIVPISFNGHMLAGGSPWVDSANINSYPVIKTEKIKYDWIKLAQDVTGEPNEGDTICNTLADLRTALTAAANADFAAGVDLPAISLEIDMALLATTEQYKDFAALETVSLGDTVHCRHSRLGITSDARAVAIKYDCLRKEVSAVTLSAQPQNIFRALTTAASAVKKAIKESGTVKAEQIAGFIDGAMTQLRIQNTVAEHQDVRAILFEDLDSTSPTFGALSIGTQGLQISQERTPDGRDWVWTTAITAEGVIASTLIAQETLAVAKHFFADGSGVHVTEDEYDATTGKNVLITGSGVNIRDGTTTLATFGSTMTIGQNSQSHVTVSSASTSFYAAAGSLAARLSYSAATQTTGEIGGGYTGAIANGNGYTFPLRYYPVNLATYPLDVSMTYGGAAAIYTISDETPVATIGGTLEYRSSSNSLRLTATSDVAWPGVSVTIESTYNTYSPRYVFGNGVSANGFGFIEGRGTQAAGIASHAGGQDTYAGGSFSLAFGEQAHATGRAAVATGYMTQAEHNYSATFGSGSRSGRANQLVAGRYNAVDSDALFIVGNGTDATDRYNIFSVNHTGSKVKGINADFSSEVSAGRFLPGQRDLMNGEDLDANAALNRGHYRATSTIAPTLVHCPTSNYFHMYVMSQQAADPDIGVGVTQYQIIIDSTGATWARRIALAADSTITKTDWRKTISEDASGAVSISGALQSDHVRLINELSVSYDSTTELTPARICAVLKARAGDFIAGTNIVNFQASDGPTRATLYVTYVNDATAATAFCLSMWQASDVTFYRKPANSDTWALYYDPASQNQSAKLATITPIEINSLTNGSVYSANGGCNYYKIGTRVHVHMAVSGITSGSAVNIYTMPAGYRPASGSIITGAAYSATYTCGGYISGSTGAVYAFTARSNGTVTLDFDYDAFS